MKAATSRPTEPMATVYPEQAKDDAHVAEWFCFGMPMDLIAAARGQRADVVQEAIRRELDRRMDRKNRRWQMKFRKKPVVIEAVHYDGTPEGYDRVCAFAPGVHFDLVGDGKFMVPTLESPHEASPGDWIIREVKGELYPCKPDIFDVTYEPAE